MAPDSPARILCLDVGMRRIGVAVSDLLNITAQPLEVIDRKVNDPLERVPQLIDETGATTIVVGLPLTLDGREGPAVRRVRKLTTALEDKLPEGVAIVEWDERMSTMAAERALKEGHLSGQKRRVVVDSVAASLILQGYLAQSSIVP